MKRLYRYIKLSTLSFGFLFFSACNFVEIDHPTDKIITSTLFQDESTATSAVLGLYAKLVRTGSFFSSGGTTVFTGLTSDELFTTNPALTTYIQFESNQIAVDNNNIYTNFWRGAYEIIYITNSCLEGLENSSNIREAVKEQYIGECYFIRAFCYWYLLQLFGDVPLALSSDYKTNKSLFRADKNIVKQQILNDLTEAKKRLNADYPTTGKVRVNYYTVLALLSRYYLYEENWPEAERLTDEILQSPLYKFETDINRVFLIEGTESIWQLASGQPNFNSMEGAIFIPLALPTISPTLALTDHLLGAFETNDLRRTSWVATKTVQSRTYRYPLKYKIRQNTIKTENQVVFRLGEIYLIRAEALAHLERPKDALDMLNILRQRANLPDRTLENTPDVFDAIQQERRIELFAEWGHRWFDLRRTGKIDEVLSAIKPEWKSTAAYFPIPLNEILANPNLVPNDGYTN